jgi:hypothetical protein
MKMCRAQQLQLSKKRPWAIDDTVNEFIGRSGRRGVVASTQDSYSVDPSSNLDPDAAYLEYDSSSLS